jgi:hypothetical protein
MDANSKAAEPAARCVAEDVGSDGNLRVAANVFGAGTAAGASGFGIPVARFGLPALVVVAALLSAAAIGQPHWEDRLPDLPQPVVLAASGLYPSKWIEAASNQEPPSGFAGVPADRWH